MTTTELVEAEPVREMPLWRLAIAGFLPDHKRDRSQRWIALIPMTLILLVQAVLTMRLRNTAYRDEALYIYEGHRQIAAWLHGAPQYDQPAHYFSGAPGIYPVIAAVLDRAGGLMLVRAFSLVCMLLATLAVYSFTKRLFSQRIAYGAAIAFAFAGPTAMLGNFATFDAMALMLIAVSTATGVRAVQTRNFLLAVPVGLMLTLAVCTKYAAGLFVPVVLITILITKGQRKSALIVTLIAGMVGLESLAAIASTIGKPELDGIRATTLNRKPITYATPLDILHISWNVAGMWFVIGIAGAVFLALRVHRWRPAILFLIAGLLPVLYQAKIHEQVSLDKHIGFGLVFLAPVIGVLLAAPLRALWQRFAVVALTLALIITGLASSRGLFTQWSDSSALESALAYSLHDDPYLHTLGDVKEPMQFAFEDSTQYWQWDSTDVIYYDGKYGEDAARAGLAAHYWQYVYLNGTTQVSRDIIAMMSTYGYKATNVVKMHNDKYGDETYYIFENYSGVTN